MIPFLLEALGAPTPLPRSPAFGQDNAAAQLYAVTITQNFHPPVTHALEKINDDGYTVGLYLCKQCMRSWMYLM